MGKCILLGPKINTFLKICSLEFSEIIPNDRVYQVGISDCFEFLGKIAMPIVEEMGDFWAYNFLAFSKVIPNGSISDWVKVTSRF